MKGTGYIALELFDLKFSNLSSLRNISTEFAHYHSDAIYYEYYYSPHITSLVA